MADKTFRFGDVILTDTDTGLTFNSELSFAETINLNGVTDAGISQFATANIVTSLTNSGTFTQNGATNFNAATQFNYRTHFKRASNVTFGSTLVLPFNGNVFPIIGGTAGTLNLISTDGWQEGSVIYLYFDSVLTIKNNYGGAGQIINPGLGDISALPLDVYDFCLLDTYWMRVK